MRKVLFLSLAIVAITTNAAAQSWLTAGNTLTGTEKFGSTNNKSLDIVTNNTVRMKINNKGNIGMGITTLGVNDRLSVKITAPVPTATYTMTRGIFAEVTGNATATFNSPTVAIYGKSNNNNDWGYGGYFEGDLYGAYGKGKYGFFGYGTGASFTGDDLAVGVKGLAEGDDIINYGVYGTAPSDASAYNYGVAAYAGGSFFGNYALLAVDELGGPGAAGFFDGDIEYTGSIFDVSDRQFKTNIKDLDNALSRINQLQPKSYDMKADEFGGLTFGRNDEMGFIAQEVQEVFPELVKSCVSPVDPYTMGGQPSKTEPFEFLAVNYVGLIPVLTKGIQEQQAMINEQANVIKTQEAVIADLVARVSKLETKQNSNIEAVIDGNNARLEQNTPNPFEGTTAIGYFIPEHTSSAKLIISDMTGREIKSIDINTIGNGTVQLTAGALSAGNYTYTLVADGVVVGTKFLSVAK